MEKRRDRERVSGKEMKERGSTRRQKKREREGDGGRVDGRMEHHLNYK